MLESKVKNEYIKDAIDRYNQYVKAAIDQYSGYVDGGYEDVLLEIAAEKKILDRNAYINQARKEGVKEGLKEGEEKGKKEGKIELAKKLVYEKKWDVEEALNFVGLDNSYVNLIQKTRG